MAWQVFFREAYDAWIKGFHPSLDDEAAMVGWLEALETSGPPPIVSERTIGTIPCQESDGPHNERVTYRHDKAHIGIIDIRPWPKREPTDM